MGLKARSAECRTTTPASDDEIFEMKRKYWHLPIGQYGFHINNEQIGKLDRRLKENLIELGNFFYEKRRD